MIIRLKEKGENMVICTFNVETLNNKYQVIITDEGFTVAGMKGTDLHLKIGEPLRLTGGEKKNITTSPVKRIFK